jgi:hypothetical protein
VGQTIVFCRLSAPVPHPVSTRPPPFLVRPDQSRPNRIILDILNQPPHLLPRPHPMIKRLILPESRSRPPQDPIRHPPSPPFDPWHSAGDLSHRPKNRMNMIRHNHPRDELIKMPCRLVVKQGIPYDRGNPRVLQPHRSRPAGVRNRPRQPPGNEDRLPLWNPMRKMSASEGHCRLHHTTDRPQKTMVCPTQT